ncbi:MAG: phosphatase PAP2 family protein [Tissierellia bacterium]|nr:phosphatase PAP2 family protein [Tissierellia bacterium]
MNFITKIDINILNWIAENLRHPLLDKLMLDVTSLGDMGIFWICLLIVFFTTKEYKQMAKVMFISMIISVIVCNLMLKPIVHRTRPFNINTAIELIAAKPLDYSFPSGHTMFSFTSVTVILMMAKSKLLKYFTLAIAILIALSRMYLYFHYPTDVLAGFILGSLISYFTVKYMKNKNLHLFK